MCQLLRPIALCTALALLATAGCKADEIPAELFSNCPPPVQSAAVRISAGHEHTCLIDGEGHLWCWGTGALGLADTDNAATPRRVVQLDDVRQVAADSTSCAVLGDGSVSCWGDADAQLLPEDVDQSPIPVQVAGLDEAQAVAVGGSFACALHRERWVSCWGQNDDGGLGTGNTTEKKGVVTVELPDDPVRLAAGSGTACAVLINGGVACWGEANYGQLGRDVSNVGAPDVVPGVSCATDVFVGDDHACAIGEGGKVSCWGLNNDQQTGDRAASAYIEGDWITPAATPLPGLSDVLAGGGGEGHSCVVTKGKGALCWGSNEHGEGGDGTGVSKSAPTALDVAEVDAVAVGGGHGCALTGDDDVWCWGENRRGQLGQGAFPDATGIVAIPDSAAGKGLSAAGATTCMLVGSQPVCWGFNRYGQASAVDKRTAVSEPKPALTSGEFSQVAAGGTVSCGIDKSKVVQCWGASAYDSGADVFNPAPPGPVKGLGAATQVTVSKAGWGMYACAIDTTKKGWCWGFNDSGQLGSGTTTTSAVPLAVQVSADLVQIAAGFEHTCAVDTASRVWCWGQAEYGALGHEEGIAPALVPGVKATQVEVGLRHTCALDSQQRVWCWGGNDRGQLGKGSADEGKGAPAVVLEGAHALSVGSDATCAVVGGNLNCWGLNDEAQVFGRAAADGSDYLAKPTPTGLVDVTVVALATDHGCAMTAAKGVHCWGNNRWGQHGAGPRDLWSNSPVKVQRTWP